MTDKMYVIRKFIKANSAAQALRLEKKLPADECYISDDWKEGKNQNLADAMGFKSE
jgi:hypothetical protein